MPILCGENNRRNLIVTKIIGWVLFVSTTPVRILHASTLTANKSLGLYAIYFLSQLPKNDTYRRLIELAALVPTIIYHRRDMHASQFALILPIPPLRANMGGGLEDAEYPINKNELGPNSSLPRKPD